MMIVTPGAMTDAPRTVSVLAVLIEELEKGTIAKTDATPRARQSKPCNA
jgi:hypothetical protein